MKHLIFMSLFVLVVTNVWGQEGIYYIRLANGKVLDAEAGQVHNNGGKIQIWDRVGGENQKWMLKKTTRGSFIIQSVASKKVLDLGKDHINVNGGVVQMWQFIAGAANQEWRLQDLGSGRYSIRNAASTGNKILDVQNGLVNDNGTKVHTWDFANLNNQIWYLERIGDLPTVMTRFDPVNHGFKFANRFKNIFISELNWTTSGLCGGMVYSALDYFKRNMRIPQQNYMPAEGTTLQSYIYNRQVHSVTNNIDKWAEYGVNPFGSRNREFFSWGIQGHLERLTASLDRGEPVPLGLQACGSDCRCPNECLASHQVLAIGYYLGSYMGDANNCQEVTIYVYDPNHPNQTRSLKPNLAGAWYEIGDANSRWRAYFADSKYTQSTPPNIPDTPNEISIQFDTGGDDLRGGNDNVNAILLTNTGRELRFDNINKGKRWIDNTSQTVGVSLPNDVLPTQIIGIRLETTFGGGLFGDNWNLDNLYIRSMRNGWLETLFSREGKPLFRFTGDAKIKEFR